MTNRIEVDEGLSAQGVRRNHGGEAGSTIRGSMDSGKRKSETWPQARCRCRVVPRGPSHTRAYDKNE